MVENLNKKIIVLDMGSQYTQLIARRVRELNVYCEIVPFNILPKSIDRLSVGGIIISGGPSGVNEKNCPLCRKGIFSIGIPVLGICYGMQLIARLFGGNVFTSGRKEFGKAKVYIDLPSKLLKGINSSAIDVWMSHGDCIDLPPEDFVTIAHSANSPAAVIENRAKKIFGIQFHPEVTHTEKGMTILGNFVHEVCGIKPYWSMKSFVKEAVKDIQKRVKDKRVICAVSGGVDSAVTAVLLHQAVGDRLTCIFVNNGLLRKDEYSSVVKKLKDSFNVKIIAVNEEKRFLKRLMGVTDPEKKRKIIGNEFISVFEENAKKLGDITFLAQGTLYTDVIESLSYKGGPSKTIKSHHNVGGLPDRMNLRLIEPLKSLFKDEVRALGRELSIPETILNRHPFPGPGLAIRIIGNIKKMYLQILRDADEILLDEIKKSGMYVSLWQVFAVLIPVKTVGVMGDNRTYDYVIALRAITSLDGMTADWAKIPYDILERISNRVINEVKGVNRVVYDISSKPPATIEWE